MCTTRNVFLHTLPLFPPPPPPLQCWLLGSSWYWRVSLHFSMLSDYTGMLPWLPWYKLCNTLLTLFIQDWVPEQVLRRRGSKVQTLVICCCPCWWRRWIDYTLLESDVLVYIHIYCVHKRRELHVTISWFETVFKSHSEVINNLCVQLHV